MIATGPFLAKENLVFGYDTGYPVPAHLQSGNVYAGRPTTNYIAYQNAVRQSSYTDYSATASGTWNTKHPHAIRAYNAEGTDITGYVNTGVTDWTNTYHAHWQYDDDLKKPVTVQDAFDGNWKAKNYDANTVAWTNYGMSTGKKYVISWLQWTNNVNKAVHVGVYCKNSSNSNNFWDGLSGGSTTSKNTKPYTWQRVYHVYTVSSNHDVTINYDRIYMYGHSLGPNSISTTIKIADVQLELDTDHPSAFLDSNPDSSTTVRSSTESLFDIAKASTIDINNVSFDSTNGLPTFDGTDDKIVVSNFPHIWDGNVTFETVVSWNDDSRSILFGNYNVGANDINLEKNTGRRLRFYWNRGERDVNTGNNVVTTTGNYHYVVMIRDTSANNFRFYVDGTLVYTSSGAGSNVTSTGSTFRIGGDTRDGTTIHNGTIPIIKIYDKVLTTREIERNYNSYKERFNL